ncbi:MAG: hypothetical protein JF625_03780 [Inquilinus limosus]|uniref:Manganese/iron superoxide dismutase C-terminal domain-containing protein n=1 Tax=Inquilinus limosus TaxID=171674 RepID=A0A952FL16_9PROT|nr:hypothetical protein [Inquilinus limosus]
MLGVGGDLADLGHHGGFLRRLGRYGAADGRKGRGARLPPVRRKSALNYLDYQNRRADHVKAVMETLVNWSVVSDRLGARGGRLLQP